MKKLIGFDNQFYLQQQEKAILERIKMFSGKLYLEFGGKILHDYHAARVLPGYNPNIKIELLRSLKDKIDILLCIYAGDIERGRIRGDFGITYAVDTLKLIDDLRENGLGVLAVVITRFDNQPQALGFKTKLENRNIRVYLHRATQGYPTDVDTIVSPAGYGQNTYIETSKPIVVVTGPGPGSGKLATCLSQLYHDHRQGLRSGYAKFETFPIWNLPLKHPVNIAYEAATADLQDFNMIDPYHLSAYQKSAVNYNRDVEIFPVIQRIMKRIMGDSMPYKSPTDMGVNQAGFAIIDDQVVQEAARQEIIRRFFRYQLEQLLGLEKKETVQRAILLMEEAGVSPEGRKVVTPARIAAQKVSQRVPGQITSGAALELPDGSIVTGKNSSLMTAASSLILNGIKQLAEIPDKIHLLAPNVIQHIRNLKKDILGLKQEILDLEETLIALSISAATNPTAELAMAKLGELVGCEVHLTHVPAPGDEVGLRRLKVNLTVDPVFPSQDLYLG